MCSLEEGPRDPCVSTGACPSLHKCPKLLLQKWEGSQTVLVDSFRKVEIGEKEEEGRERRERKGERKGKKERKKKRR